MSICKHFTNIFKDHLKNEYDDYEIIFYKISEGTTTESVSSPV